jgi:hypothetical protein
MRLNVVPVHAMKAYIGGIHSFLTKTLDGGKCSASRPGRFTTQIRTPVPIDYEAGLASETVRTSGDEKNLSLPGIKPRTVHHGNVKTNNLLPHKIIRYINVYNEATLS